MFLTQFRPNNFIHIQEYREIWLRIPTGKKLNNISTVIPAQKAFDKFS